MSKPYLCPKCNGEGRVKNNEQPLMSNGITRRCPTCNGNGVVWEPRTHYFQDCMTARTRRIDATE